METDAETTICSPEQILEQRFDAFLYTDQTLLEATEQFRSLKTDLKLDDTPHYLFFGKLKGHFTSWRVSSFMEILQRRLNVKEYAGSVNSCKDVNVFVIGAGPCGLRMAIEAALCGMQVFTVEKRSSFTRNNVLHLWPYLIHDLRNLGIKKLFGKFCAGSLDHISIRRLQLILYKIALVLGVRVFINTSYIEHLEPCVTTGWRISVKPSTLEIETVDFDVLVGADGKRNSIIGFQRKEFRAKLAIGITANFTNNKSDEEAKIEEISGVAALFNQKFFADLKTETDIDLENIVYYKDDTHYFVMTAKKQCLLKKRVLKQDYNDVIKLLSFQNVDNSQLRLFVHQAAEFSAGLPHFDFAVNPDNGQEDIAIFDFTSMYSAEYAARILERGGRRLIIGLVGDGLMEPFWPLGTGCARGFLSCFDLTWMIKQHQLGVAPKELLEERMGLYQLLHQTDTNNMNKEHPKYTFNPKTRYRLIPKFSEDVSYLYENDEKENNKRGPKYSPMKSPKKRLAGETTETVHQKWKKNTFARTRRPRNPSTETGPGTLVKKRPLSPQSDEESLLAWCREKLRPVFPALPVTDLDSCWRDGVLLCGLVHLCAPKEISLSKIKTNRPSQNVELGITVMSDEFGIQTLTAQDLLPPSGPDKLAIISTIVELKKLYETVSSDKPLKKTRILEPEQLTEDKPAMKTAEEPQSKPMPVDEKPPPGDLKKRVHSQRKLRKKIEPKFIAEVDNLDELSHTKASSTPSKGSQKCHMCSQSVLVLNRKTVEGYVFHRRCFKCEDCGKELKTSTYHLITSKDPNIPGRFYCQLHFNKIMSKSRDLAAGTLVPTETEVKIKKEKKLKTRPRPVSVNFDALKIHRSKSKSPFRPSTPDVPEDRVVVSPTPDHRPLLSVENPESRYKDTSREIHRQLPLPGHTPERAPYPGHTPERAPYPGQTPERVRARVLTSPAPGSLSHAPPPSSSGGPVVKRRSYHEDLPVEGLPDNTRSHYLSTRPSPPIDMVPTETLPATVTVRSKKSKKGKAPCPPVSVSQTSSVSKSKTESSSKSKKSKTGKEKAEQASDSAMMPPESPKTSRDVTKRTRDVIKPVRGLKSRETGPGSHKPPISAGVKGRSDELSPLTTPSPIKVVPVRHARASSVSKVDHYIPNHSKKMEVEYSSQLRELELEVDQDSDDKPLSVKDRIALCAKRDDEVSSDHHGDRHHGDRHHGDHQRKRIPVSHNLKKTVDLDTDRVSGNRSKTEEVDSGPSPFKRIVNPKRRRLRLKPTNKQNQRRLAQAQIIQRDRSLLEQKMVEFETHGADVEQQLRSRGNDTDLMAQYLELVNIKNELTRRENELHLCEKYLQLLDEQDQIDRDLRYLIESKSKSQSQGKSEEGQEEEEVLILKKFNIVNRRDYLLTQLDENKRREEEENKQINAMLKSKGMSSNLHSDSYNTDCFLTIEELLEPDEPKPCDDDKDDCLEMYEQTTAQIRSRRNSSGDNPLTKFFKRISIFGD